MPRHPISEALDSRRRAVGMTIGEIAKRTGLAHTTVSVVLYGQRPHLACVASVAEVLRLRLTVEADNDIQFMRWSGRRVP